MNRRTVQLPQDQGVLDVPVRALEDEDEDEAMDDLEKAARALGLDPGAMVEIDGLPTELG
jgi:hypothetical protein